MALPESGLTPELYAHLQAELKKAHDANQALAVANEGLRLSRDSAEAKFMKLRDDNTDLEETVIAAEGQAGALRAKYNEAESSARCLGWALILLAIVALSTSVVQTIALLE